MEWPTVQLGWPTVGKCSIFLTHSGNGKWDFTAFHISMQKVKAATCSLGSSPCLFLFFILSLNETVKMTADTLSRGRILQMASQCVVFCQAQASQGKAFKFPLKIDSSFSFDPKLIIPVLTGEQLFKYWRKNICITYLPKMWYLLAKTCSWCQWNLKFGTQTNYLMPRKKPQNNFVHWGQHHCENAIWNLQIFSVIFSSSKIFDVLFRG